MLGMETQKRRLVLAQEELKDRKFDYIKRTNDGELLVVFTGGSELRFKIKTEKYFDKDRSVAVVTLDNVPIYETF